MDLTTGESQTIAGEAAPTDEQTTGSEVANNDTSEDQDQQEQEGQQETKTFTQEELDQKIQKRLSQERRRWDREQAEKANAPKPMAEPDPKNFATQAEYIEAAAKFKAQQIVAEEKAREQQSAVLNSYAEREEAAREKYTDYEDIALLDTDKGGPAISKEMAEVILESSVGPEIAYYLGKNVEESKKIWAMKPLAQAAALGRIEQSILAKPAAKATTSNAPDPIKPINTSRASNPSINPSDPRSIEAIPNASDWIAARNKQVQNRRK